MNRAIFVDAYARLVTDVWSDPATEQRLAEAPRELLAEHGLDMPSDIALVVRRDTAGHEPDIAVQVRFWEDGLARGEVVLVVPATPSMDLAELSEAELSGVVGGMDVSCSCCCPCCCSS